MPTRPGDAGSRQSAIGAMEEPQVAESFRVRHPRNLQAALKSDYFEARGPGTVKVTLSAVLLSKRSITCTAMVCSPGATLGISKR